MIRFFDGSDGPLSDYVHIEANPAYAVQTRISNVVAEAARDGADEADGWAELYGGVLRTGVPIRFERELVATGRYLELAAFRISPPAGARLPYCSGHHGTQARRGGNKAPQRDAGSPHRGGDCRAQAGREALRQSQKMEAVGQLTGGIAHDFNNLLAGIIGTLELMETRAAPGPHRRARPLHRRAQGASKRAAALTHRLLAFSRRQTLDPKPTDVNRLVIGHGGADPAHRRPADHAGGGDGRRAVAGADRPRQLENALLNLCINARDAMPDGGRITIETANQWLDDRAAKERDLPPGQYMSLCVTDTGTGMTPE